VSTRIGCKWARRQVGANYKTGALGDGCAREVIARRGERPSPRGGRAEMRQVLIIADLKGDGWLFLAASLLMPSAFKTY